MSRTNFEQLLEAGCHFGHLKRKWNPAMAPYIFMERNDIHIIDLHKTVVKVDEAAAALKNIAKSGRKILFVATKKQAKDVVAEVLTERIIQGRMTEEVAQDILRKIFRENAIKIYKLEERLGRDFLKMD